MKSKASKRVSDNQGESIKMGYIKEELKMNPAVFFLFLAVVMIILMGVLILGVGTFSTLSNIITGLGKTIPLPIAVLALVLLIAALNSKHKHEGYY